MKQRKRVHVTGPLATYVEGFRAVLDERGYTWKGAESHLRLMAHVSRWLLRRSWQPQDLTPEHIRKFLKGRRRERYRTMLSERSLAPLLDYLRTIAVVPRPVSVVADNHVDRLLGRYEAYLRSERGLMATTLRLYMRLAREFLSCCTDPDAVELHFLTAADVTQFILRGRQSRSVGSSKFRATRLRSLLRYLYLKAETATRLDGAVPAFANWKLSTLPRAAKPQHVQRLLRSCDRRTAIGRRDYAILTVLGRLGLRAGEVVALELDDIDWRLGELVVRGKGRRHERLPLPVDVGEAIAGYLRRGRPRCESRNVFLRCLAPRVGLGTGGINKLVKQACIRASVPHVSPHQLRHTVATQMLRRGAPLSEIAQVLRHRSHLSTAIYAKVDREALRGLAQPWPGVDS